MHRSPRVPLCRQCSLFTACCACVHHAQQAAVDASGRCQHTGGAVQCCAHNKLLAFAELPWGVTVFHDPRTPAIRSQGRQLPCSCDKPCLQHGNRVPGTANAASCSKKETGFARPLQEGLRQCSIRQEQQHSTLGWVTLHVLLLVC
jgi:hypothetical protein